MDQDHAITMLAALAHASRLAAFRLLAEAGAEGLPAGEIARRLGVVQNTMSGHLATLSDADLIEGERSGRIIRYRLRPEATRGLLAFLVEDCCNGDPAVCGLPPRLEQRSFPRAWAAGRVFDVLFVCTGNSARSIMAEAIVNHEHGSRFRAHSAGSNPSGTVRAEALDLLRRLGYPTAGLRSKGWAEFARKGAPAMDFVFTLCDEAAGESCPAWPGQPMTAHWGNPDPARATGTDQERAVAYARALRTLERRIGLFASLPFAELERISLQRRLDEIGSDQSEWA